MALDSPSSFFAVTLYLPASSTVTFLISRVAKYEWPSLSTVSWNGSTVFDKVLTYLLLETQDNDSLLEPSDRQRWSERIAKWSETNNFSYVDLVTKLAMYDRSRRLTLCLGESLTKLPSWNHVTFGVGSAVMRHSKSNRLPSSSCLIAGFFAKVGAIPSICLQERMKI